MIIDTLDQIDKLELGPRFTKALAWLKANATADIPAGHHVIETAEDGTETIYVNVQEYETRAPENCALEYHRAYADIQFLFKGTEAISWVPLTADLPETKPYSQENDIGFVGGAGTPIPFPKDGFFILYPQDAHAPGMRYPEGTPVPVKKAVIKVLL